MSTTSDYNPAPDASVTVEYVPADVVEELPPAVLGQTSVEPDTTAEPASFSADYVRELREEAAAHRVKSKRTDVANERLATSYAASTGRLVDVGELTYSDAFLGDDGVVDRDKVVAAVDALLAEKPYLARMTPYTPIPQGVQPEDPAPAGLFDLMRSQR